MTTLSADALAALAAIVGPEGVLTDAAAEARFGPGTAPGPGPRPVIVQPADEPQVQALVLAARAHRIALYPVSTGQNWGYGDARPPQAGTVIVDLSRMTRILDVDVELGVVTIEPGVTQQQLDDHFRQAGIPLLVPLTGAGGSCSILGNALDRGFGGQPVQDHFLAVTSLRAVLADGSLYQSPLAEAGAQDGARIHKWGVGPYADGLFSQGHFGIVSQMTIALERVPEEVSALGFTVRRDQDLTAALAALQRVLHHVPLILGRIILSSDVHYLARTSTYPDQAESGGDTLSEARIIAMMGRVGQVKWFGATQLYGSNAIVSAAEGHVRRELKPLGISVAALRRSMLQRRRRWLRPLHQWPMVQRWLRQYDAIEATWFRPFERNLRLAYWRANVPPPEQDLNPGRDGCGVLWYAPILPFRPAKVAAFAAEAEAICRHHGIEPQMRLVLISSRQVDCLLPVVFDRRDAAAEAKAVACYEALLAAGRRQGYVPYRLSATRMADVVRPEAPFWRMLAAFKRALDPDDLISPGRYGVAGSTAAGEGVDHV
jgi:4-cresol dehydrogenase (hydroxylating)